MCGGVNKEKAAGVKEVMGEENSGAQEKKTPGKVNREETEIGQKRRNMKEVTDK